MPDLVGIAVAAALFAVGWTINAALYAPWRVRPLARFLFTRSAWYRRWFYRQAMRRMTCAFRKATIDIGERMAPAIQTMTQAVHEWLAQA